MHSVILTMNVIFQSENITARKIVVDIYCENMLCSECSSPTNIIIIYGKNKPAGTAEDLDNACPSDMCGKAQKMCKVVPKDTYCQFQCECLENECSSFHVYIGKDSLVDSDKPAELCEIITTVLMLKLCNWDLYVQ